MRKVMLQNCKTLDTLQRLREVPMPYLNWIICFHTWWIHWRNIPCSWIGRINIVKMAILPKAIYRFNAIPINQATNGIFHRTRTNIFTIYMEIQKTLNSQSNLEKEEWNWRNQHAWLQTILQSHSHLDSMILEQWPIYRSMEQYWKPRDKATNLWSPYLRQRRQIYTMEKRQRL